MKAGILGPLLVVFLMALGGCAELPGRLPRPAVERLPAADIRDYALTGRISVSHGEARYIVNISWRHEAALDEIFLTTPLGSGIATLTRDAAGARLITADHGRMEAGDWDELAQQAFGVDLPLERLPRWVLADAPAGAQRDRAGRPAHFSEDGWSVDFGAYESELPLALPVLIELRRDDVAVRLKIDAWERVVARLAGAGETQLVPARRRPPRRRLPSVADGVSLSRPRRYVALFSAQRQRGTADDAVARRAS